jgi:hypothetical protein
MNDQGAVIVGKIPQRAKGQSKSIRNAPDSLMESGRPQLDLSKYFKVIDHKPSIVDEDLNETIQREGCHLSGMHGMGGESVWGGSLDGNVNEVEWYERNKYRVQ